MLTRNHRQEALCRCYVRAIATGAGLSISEPESDYGIDMTLRAISFRDKKRRDLGPQFDVQLKSTTRAALGTGQLIYDLDVINYDDLRQASKLSPRLLVVMVQPEDEVHWLGQSTQELILRHCAYWLSLKGYPAATSTTSVRVHMPLTNIFSVTAVQGIVQRLREEKDP